MSLNLRVVTNLLTDRVDALPLAILYITDRCNSKCIMCNIWKMVDNDAPSLADELAVEEIDKILERNSRFFSNLNHVSITGGDTAFSLATGQVDADQRTVESMAEVSVAQAIRRGVLMAEGVPGFPAVRDGGEGQGT